MRKKPIHPSVTMQRVLDAAESEITSLENPGICLTCGADAYDCEPDARMYTCEDCGCPTVYGASELLQMGAYHDAENIT